MDTSEIHQKQSLLYKIGSHPFVYHFCQRTVARPTVRCYEDLAKKHCAFTEERRVLEIGCGLGTFRPFVRGKYTGIDADLAFVGQAKKKFPDAEFFVMSAEDLTFPPKSFDEAISIATFHHLSDQQIEAQVIRLRSVCAPGAQLHVIDNLMPDMGTLSFKRWYFRQDRGNHQRTQAEHIKLLSRLGQVTCVDRQSSPLHEVGYFRLVL